MPATSALHRQPATHARHAAHAAAWRVLGRTATDHGSHLVIPTTGLVGDGAACGGGRGDERGDGNRAELDRRIDERVRGEVEKMEAVARRVLCDMNY